MANIPFPIGLQGTDKVPRTRQALQNCFNVEGTIIRIPGISSISAALTSPARGSFEWNGSLYSVNGTNLIKFTSVTTGAFTIIGTIAGSENIEWAIGFNDAVIVVKGGTLYTLSTTDVLTDISGNANFVACVDVAHIDGRFVYIPADGDPAFFSDVGAAGTVQVASFFDAEELPDKNNAVINFKNTLYILGEDSIEAFKDVGTFPNPFARIQGARSDFGYHGGLQEYAETFIFIGREKDQDKGIYAYTPGSAIKISNEPIDVILDKYTEGDLANVIVNRFKWLGYDIATFTLHTDSFCYFRGQWSKLDAIIDGISRPWKAGFITEFETKYYATNNVNFGKLEDINTQFGNRITRIIDIGFNHPEGKRFGCSRIELGISQGFNSDVGSVALFMSRNNVEYPIPIYRDLGNLGKYTDRLVWQPPGGLGNYEGFMGIRIYTTEDVVFSSNSLIVDIN